MFRYEVKARYYEEQNKRYGPTRDASTALFPDVISVHGFHLSASVSSFALIPTSRPGSHPDHRQTMTSAVRLPIKMDHDDCPMSRTSCAFLFFPSCCMSILLAEQADAVDHTPRQQPEGRALQLR